MDFSILSVDGVAFVLRWFHYFFGVIWIGLLYYFNFVQGAFFNETDANTKSAAIQKLVPRALWWFRWGAMFTFLTGWLIIGNRLHVGGIDLLSTSWGISILTGGLLGTFMWFNVWFVIWPNQKIVIASSAQAAQGKGPLPEAAAAGARALVASRTNTMFSIPMLFFMGAASHLPLNVTVESPLPVWWAVFAAVLAVLEFNALKGKTGPMTSVKGVIHCGFALAIGLYLIMEVVL